MGAACLLLLGAALPAWAQGQEASREVSLKGFQVDTWDLLSVSHQPGFAAALDHTAKEPRKAVSNNAPEAESQDSQEAEAEGGQDEQTKALDSTATQWSFQFAYQVMPDYHQDTMDNGEVRPVGSDDYWQLRVLVPVALKHLTILPRITMRHYKNAQGDAGFGNTEVFALIIPKFLDWGTGRTGAGPLVTLPGNDKVARDEWGYGFAAAAVNSTGPWFYGLLFTQSWRSIDPTALPPGGSNTNPLGIAPIVNFRLGTSGWYLGNGDMVIRYDWSTKKWYVPIGVRFGKVFVQDYGTWNFYGEYQTSLLYKSYLGPAVKNSFRINLTFTIPV